MSADWILDTPANKRWWLPDRIHSVGSNIYGDEIRMDVTNQFTGECRQSVVFKLCTKDGKETAWRDWCDMFDDLAKKKYPQQLRHKTISIHRQRVGL